MQVLTTVLEDALEDTWTSEIAAVWNNHWNHCCEALFAEIRSWEENAEVGAAIWERVRRYVSTPCLPECMRACFFTTSM